MLSAHFGWAELGSPPRELEGAMLRIARALETIRTAAGSPIEVTSGYRTAAHNAAVGGARRSWHLSGRAADFRAVIGAFASPPRMAALLEALIRLGRLENGGIGIYPTWVHYDLGPEGRRWTAQ